MISSLAKKLKDFIRPLPDPENDVQEEDGLLFYFRKEMIGQIQNGDDCRDIMLRLIQSKVSSFATKYAMLNVRSLLHMNNQNIAGLRNIVSGLSLIVKYSLCLLDPIEDRRDTWHTFTFNHYRVKNDIMSLIGYDTILNQLGYVKSTEDGLAFAPGTEPDLEVVANLIVDMMLFKTEMKEFIRGRHPMEYELCEFLLDNTIAEMQVYRESFLVQDPQSDVDATDDLSSSDENPFCERRTKSSQALSEVAGPTSTTCNRASGLSSGSLTIVCDVCGEEAQVFCRECSKKPLCDACNVNFHKHPNRRGHEAEAITDFSKVSLENQPLVQVEGAYGITAQQQSLQASRLNKSQETEVVKSPSKARKIPNNVPAFGLLGLNSVDEHSPQQNPLKDRNNTYQVGIPSQQPEAYRSPSQFRQMSRSTSYGGASKGQAFQNVHNPAFPTYSHLNSQHKNYPSPTTPLTVSVPPNTIPSYSLSPSMHQQQWPSGPMTMEGHNLYQTPLMGSPMLPSAQLNYNLTKLNSNSPSPMAPRQHLESGHTGGYNMYPTGPEPSMTSHMLNQHHHLNSLHPQSYLNYQDQPMVDPNPTGQMYSPQGRPNPLPHSAAMSLSHNAALPLSQSSPMSIQHKAALPIYNQSPQSPMNPAVPAHFTQGQTNTNNPSDYFNKNVPQSLVPQPTFNHMQQSSMGAARGMNHLPSKDERNVDNALPYKLLNIGGHNNNMSNQKIPYTSSEYCAPLRQSLSRNPVDEMSDLCEKLSSDCYISPVFEGILTNIKTATSAESRREYCRRAEEELGKLLSDTDHAINEMLRNCPDPISNPEFMKLTTKKKYFLNGMDEMQSLLKKTGDKEMITNETASDLSGSNVIYFPPPLPLSNSAKTTNISLEEFNTNLQSGYDDAGNSKDYKEKCRLFEEMSKQPSNFLITNNQIASTSSRGSIKTAEKFHHKSKPTPRVPVESSNIAENFKPPVPPRPSPKKASQDLGDVLNQIVNPPNKHQLSIVTKQVKWKCKHCTFLSDESSHACEMCSKTSDNPELVHVTPVSQYDLDQEGNVPPGDSLIGAASNVDVLEVGKSSFVDHHQKVMFEKQRARKEYNLKRQEDAQLQNSSASNVQKPAGNDSINNRSPSEAQGINILATLAHKREMEKMAREGKEFLALIKDVERRGFKAEAAPIAQTFCRAYSTTPLQWLDQHWKTNLHNIVSRVRIAGNEKGKQNYLGELSLEEAETAFISCHGNVNEAIKSAVEKRKELYTHLSTIGNFAKEEILDAMTASNGNVDVAERHLIDLVLKPFVARMWDNSESKNNDQAQFHSGPSSIIRHDQFREVIYDEEIDVDRRMRMMFVEGKLQSWGRAGYVVKILDEELDKNELEEITLEDVVDAVKNCKSFKNALDYMRQECLSCYGTFPMRKIRNSNFCRCKMCEECLINFYTNVIREKYVRNFACPFCFQPDMNNDEIATDYLGFLTLQLPQLLSKDLMELFEIKMRDFRLQKDPNFRWCAHCGVGFMGDPNRLCMHCYSCNKETCYKCKKQWEPQHEQLTCEEYALWKIENDPKNQAEGLAKHLEENGIDCPNCKMRFALAKGGCMHFHCPECGHEFCSGCNETFYQANVCTKYRSCKPLGLHCHHPRDCFSYLRDENVVDLQSLLKDHEINFNVTTPEDQEDVDHCPVMEQKENGAVKADEKCGKDSADGQAGLCEQHYKEYLTSLINANLLDPVQIMEINRMEVLLKKYDVEPPARMQRESEDEFKAKLVTVIQEKMPITRK